VEKLGGHPLGLNAQTWQESIREVAQEPSRSMPCARSRRGRGTRPRTLLHELEASFSYEETADQLAAIEDVLATCSRPDPWIASSAATSALEDGGRCPRRLQGGHGRETVAILVPTTVLAEQHLLTFSAAFYRPFRS